MRRDLLCSGFPFKCSLQIERGGERFRLGVFRVGTAQGYPSRLPWQDGQSGDCEFQSPAIGIRRIDKTGRAGMRIAAVPDVKNRFRLAVSIIQSYFLDYQFRAGVTDLDVHNDRDPGLYRYAQGVCLRNEYVFFRCLHQQCQPAFTRRGICRYVDLEAVWHWFPVPAVWTAVVVITY